MITVHHLERSRSHRVLWLLEELELEYELKTYQRSRSLLAPDSLKAIHPLGKSPVITDGDVVVAESGAILDYIVNRYGDGRLRPKPGTPEMLQYSYWMHYAEGSFMPLLVMRMVFSRIPPGVPLFIRPVAKLIVKAVHQKYLDPQTKMHLDFIDTSLGDRPWFTGSELTAADIQMSYPVAAAKSRVAGGERPHLAGFLKRAEARPAYQRALEKGGPMVLST